MFDNAKFIKASKNFSLDFVEDKNLCPMFRRSFTVDSAFEKAELSVCALGIGYSFINGKEVTDELFAPPYGNYEKRLWYVKYDVTELLKVGENVISFIVGNGFYNEDMPNDWGSEKAAWRDQPKVIATLTADGKEIISTDESFKCSINSPYVMNRLRTGVIYDARLYDSAWNGIVYDDSAWESAVIDAAPPKGRFSLCNVKGMKEYDVYTPLQTVKKPDGRIIFDFGYNHSGIIHFSTNQKAGDTITFRYAESLDGDLNPNYNERTKWPYSSATEELQPKPVQQNASPPKKR
jgi:alpha-L-rhamnosidase